MDKNIIKSETNVDNLYIRRITLIDGSQYECDDFETETAYTLTGDYIGSVDTAEFLCRKMQIKPECISKKHTVCSIGFCEADNKWYGWSHRAYYGFTVGSKVSVGDAAYEPSTVEELYVAHCKWYQDMTYSSQPKAYCDYEKNCLVIEHATVKKVSIPGAPLYIPDNDEIDTTIDNIPGYEGIHWRWEPDDPEYEYVYPGRGEWTAQSLNDAKKMAIDFANAVG